jgi:hypothetical protein
VPSTSAMQLWVQPRTRECQVVRCLQSAELPLCAVLLLTLLTCGEAKAFFKAMYTAATSRP